MQQLYIVDSLSIYLSIYLFTRLGKAVKKPSTLNSLVRPKSK